MCTLPWICELEAESKYVKVGVLHGTAHSISSKTFLILSGKSLNLVDFVRKDAFESLYSVSTFRDTAH